jgi:hypothetical protein
MRAICLAYNTKIIAVASRYRIQTIFFTELLFTDRHMIREVSDNRSRNTRGPAELGGRPLYYEGRLSYSAGCWDFKLSLLRYVAVSVSGGHFEVNPTRPQIFPGDVYNIDFPIAQSAEWAIGVVGLGGGGGDDKWAKSFLILLLVF